MKTLLFLTFVFTSQIVSAQVSPPKVKQDSLHRADSLARRKADSTRISQSSPLFIKKNNQATPLQPMGTLEPEKKIQSQYTYDSDGRVSGGQSTIKLGKKKKKN